MRQIYLVDIFCSNHAMPSSWCYVYVFGKRVCHVNKRRRPPFIFVKNLKANAVVSSIVDLHLFIRTVLKKSAFKVAVWAYQAENTHWHISKNWTDTTLELFPNTQRLRFLTRLWLRHETSYLNRVHALNYSNPRVVHATIQREAPFNS